MERSPTAKMARKGYPDYAKIVEQLSSCRSRADEVIRPAPSRNST